MREQLKLIVVRREQLAMFPSVCPFKKPKAAQEASHSLGRARTLQWDRGGDRVREKERSYFLKSQILFESKISGDIRWDT